MSVAPTPNLVVDLHGTLLAHCERYRSLLDQVTDPHLFSAVRCILEHRRDAARQLQLETSIHPQTHADTTPLDEPSQPVLIFSLMRGHGVFLLRLLQIEQDLYCHYNEILRQPDLQADLRAMLLKQLSMVDLNIRHLQIEQQQAA